MSTVWNTKYGTRRVRENPPTLEEAIAAAQGLTDDVAQQAEVAAELMGVDVADVLAHMPKPVVIAKNASLVQVASRTGASRTVLVERKVSRRRVI